MLNNWKKYKLGDISVLSYGKMPKSELIGMGEYNIYSGYQIKGKYPEFNCEAGKLLVIARGVGGTGDVKLTKEKHYVTNLSILINLDNNIALDAYVYYKYLNSNLEYLNSGSAQSQITINDLQRIEIELPNILEQRQIIEILSSLDDKIELNLQTNKTLEEMANALYKHWFVDFGPFQNGKFIESELGLIPEGWEVVELKDIADIVMGQSPESKFYNEIGEGLPFHQGVSDYGIRFPDDRIYSTEGNRFANEGDILFSVRAPVGKINISKHKIILGRGLAGIKDKCGVNNFLFYSLKNQFKTLDSIGSGTVYNSVNKSDMEKINILTPGKQIKQSFNDILKDLDAQYFNNDSENIILKQTRDYLLPKLISGEIRVKDAVKLAKEVL